MKIQLETKIKERLKVIYQDQEKEKTALELLKDKLDKYPEADTRNSSFSEEDSILITYGDTITDQRRPGLEVLDEFLEKFVKDSIKTVHLLPMYPYTSDDGFSVVDYRKINSVLGDWDDIKRLSQNYNLMFDAVINHVSKSSEWFQGYRDGRKPYEDFFITCDPEADYSSVIRPRTLPLLTEVDTVKGKQFVWTTFSEDQIDLNYRSPELLAEILDILLMYTGKGAKYIRLDAIGFMWKEAGTGCMHLKQTHEIIKLMKDIFQYYAPETKIVTETNVPHEENVSYFGENGDEADMVYQFPLPPLTLYTLLTGNAEILMNWIERLKLPNDKVTYFNFLSSHDGIGMRPTEGILTEEQRQVLINHTLKNGGEISYKNNEDGTKSPYELNINYQDALAGPDESDEERRKKFLAAETILLSLKGIPGIYIHSLLGSRNDYYGKTISGIPRRINREKLDYGYLAEQLENDTNRRRIFDELIRRLNIRKRESAFSPQAKQKVIRICPEVLGLKRENEKTGDKVFVIINVSHQKVHISKSTISGEDLISGRKIRNEFQLEPWECLWIQ